MFINKYIFMLFKKYVYQEHVYQETYYRNMFIEKHITETCLSRNIFTKAYIYVLKKYIYVYQEIYAYQEIFLWLISIFIQ